MAIRYVQGAGVREFWNIWPGWSHLKQENAASPIINKLGTILANKHVRAIFDRPKGLNLRNLMDQGGVMIATISGSRSIVTTARWWKDRDAVESGRVG